MIKLQNSTFSYGSKNIISNLTLDIPQGTTLLLGENGIGKTTLLRLIAGINFVHSGSITINHKDVRKRTTESLKNIRYVPDTPIKYEIKIDKYLKYHQQAFGLNVKKITHYLTEANISLDTNIKALSVGLNKLFSLLLACFSDAHILLLDEPMNGLDPQNQVLFYDILTEINQNKDKIILVSTHHLVDIPDAFDNLLILGEDIYSPVINLDYLKENYILNYTCRLPENIKLEDLNIIQQTEINKDVIIMARRPMDIVFENKIDVQTMYLLYLIFNRTLDSYLSTAIPTNDKKNTDSQNTDSNHTDSNNTDDTPINDVQKLT